jgi:hypothetical protein
MERTFEENYEATTEADRKKRDLVGDRLFDRLDEWVKANYDNEYYRIFARAIELEDVKILPGLLKWKGVLDGSWKMSWSQQGSNPRINYFRLMPKTQ